MSGKEKLMIADISASTTFHIVRIRRARSSGESGEKSDEKGDAEDSHLEDDSPGPLDSSATTPLALSVG